jgi:hypothetical protein
VDLPRISDRIISLKSMRALIERFSCWVGQKFVRMLRAFVKLPMIPDESRVSVAMRLSKLVMLWGKYGQVKLIVMTLNPAVFAMYRHFCSDIAGKERRRDICHMPPRQQHVNGHNRQRLCSLPQDDDVMMGVQASHITTIPMPGLCRWRLGGAYLSIYSTHPHIHLIRRFA